MVTSRRTSKRQRLDPLLPVIDESMRKRPWSSQQIESLGTFWEERAEQWQSPLDHMVNVHWSSWDFLEHSPWKSSWEALGAVRDEEPTSRRQLVDVAVDCRERDHWVPLLLASFAWGMGSTGYGPARLRTILQWGDSNPVQVEELNGVLSESVRRLNVAPVHAYAYLRGHEHPEYGTAGDARRVPGWGPAFFTKFLYFASAARQPPTRGALILDMRVARTLRRLTHQVLELEGMAEWNSAQEVKVTPEEMAKWAWADGGWWTGRYRAYLDYVAARQQELQHGIPGWPHDPAILEIALWKHYPNDRDPGSDDAK